ncbi:hypothetical protein [Mycobacterium mantenii]|uniref:HTH deoR-type domain-containing protein n=1 Tax=Mycobacterium mantenii TaxID=560555 RepID=A0A1A2T9P7_MYCNT|nr:hypothetical protein [Mycobacterium mantenii]OBH47314.1 hypothetical protein A5688_03150 [Mycobacterium mantenii]OBH73125.1 hypothetical protein A5683_25230 [Mycobacterium mantenii]
MEQSEARDVVLDAIFGRPKVEKAPQLNAENVLSLLDDSPELNGTITSPAGDVLYEGPRFTVQYAATYFDVSETTARRKLYQLADRGLLAITAVHTPGERGRRLWIHRKD